MRYLSIHGFVMFTRVVYNFCSSISSVVTLQPDRFTLLMDPLRLDAIVLASCAAVKSPTRGTVAAGIHKIHRAVGFIGFIGEWDS